MSSNNPQTREWQALSNDHHLAPFSDFKQLKEKGPRIITNAKGVYLWDSEGNKILDGMAGLWCVAIGYGRDELADAAAKQMKQLPYYNLFFQTAHPPVLELAKAIADIAPAGMNHVFFTGSGSEGNDTMLRMVRHYWAIKGQPNKKTIISRKNGYHGSTVAGASLGGMTYMHEQGDLPIPGIVHIAQPYWFGEGGDMSPEEFGIWAANQLEEKILEVGVDNVGAFIAEPIQIKLLAALENHEVTRVGAHQPSPVDVRLVAATSIDLAQAVVVGKFHERRSITSAKANWNCRRCASGWVTSCRWPSRTSQPGCWRQPDAHPPGSVDGRRRG